MSSTVRNFLRQNAIALLALYIALGGAAVAVKSASSPPKNSVKSKQIKDGQVKTKDLADQAVTGAKVADDSLTGAHVQESSLAKVPSADTLDALDSTDLLTDSGLTIVSIGTTEWVAPDPTELAVEYSGGRTQLESQTASGTGFAAANTTLPVQVAGRQFRLRAVPICADGSDASASIDHVFIRVFEGPSTGGVLPVVGSVEDPTNREDSACRRYELPTPVGMEADRFLNISLRASWTSAGADVDIAAAAAEFDFAP